MPYTLERRAQRYNWIDGRFESVQDWIMAGEEALQGTLNLLMRRQKLRPDTLKSFGGYKDFVQSSVHPLVWEKSDIWESLSGKKIILDLMGPTGGGKDSILQMATYQRPELFKRIITHTTRKPRSGEIDGVNYHFVDKNQFAHLVGSRQLVEHVYQGDNGYGTSIEALEQALTKSDIVISRVEPVGYPNLYHFLKREHPDDVACISVFTVPEISLRQLYRWILAKRGAWETYTWRARKATLEVFAGGLSDFFIVNPVETVGPTQATQAFINVLEKIRETQGSPKANFDHQEIFTLAQ